MIDRPQTSDLKTGIVMRDSSVLWRRLKSSRGLVLILVLVVLAACSGDTYPQSTLHPRGDFAELVDGLFLKTVFWATLIFIGVEGALLYAIFKFKGKPDDPDPKPTHGNTILEITWTVIPALILALVAVPTVKAIFSTAEIPSSSPDGSKPLKVEVVGHQWWWEFRYPDLGIITAGEMHVPVGRTVDLRLKSHDVIHSFWIPQFAGKRDVFPNRETRIWFTAQDTGAFPGACAEFCGLQHARMDFYVMVTPPDSFANWVTRRQADTAAAALRPLGQPVDTAAGEQLAAVAIDSQVIAGQRLFMTKACVGCHALGSAAARPTMIGPNLGGIGSRHMIAAGWLRNTDDNLAAWIKDPGEFKEGIVMAGAYKVTDAEARAIAAFLRTRQ